MTNEELKDKFIIELKQLLKKYNALLDVQENYRPYGNSNHRMFITFYSQYDKNNDLTRDYSEHDVGDNINWEK